MLITGKHFAAHRAWAIAVLLAGTACVVGYVLASRHAGRWLIGSSNVGLALGIAGGLLITFEFLIWPRKWVRGWRFLGRAQTWLKAHIWLGLLTVPLIVCHAGPRWGGWLTLTLMTIFFLVIASGIVGLALQQYVPRKIFNSIPAETIYEQIQSVAQSYSDDARKLIEKTCGSLIEDGDVAVMETDERRPAILFENDQIVGNWAGGFYETVVAVPSLADALPVKEFYRVEVAPYLDAGRKSGSSLRDPAIAAKRFSDMRQRFASAEPVLNQLNGICDRRRQFDLQSRYYWLLHGWLLVHLPLSAALMLLMIVHIVSALFY